MSSPACRPLAKYRVSLLAIGSCVMFSVGLFLIELPYHVAEEITVSRDQTIYVLGDSISSGLRDRVRVKETAWPEVLAQITGLRVANLAGAGATLQSALAFQAKRVSIADSVVVLEIGGVDVLEHTDASEFEFYLEELLKKVGSTGAKIVMFEIPLPPLCNRYGRIQRALAKEYRVTLIPKRFMTNVTGMEGGTIDGLHLSQTGHDALAKSLKDIIRIE